MTDLRRLAEAAQVGPWSRRYIETRALAYIAAASPDVILALLDERDRLRAALKECRMFLDNPDWGTVRYMEGSEVYGDIQKMKATVESALAVLDAEREGRS